MARSRLNRMVSMEDLRHEMDNLFENFLGTTPTEMFRGRKGPPVDMWEQGDQLLVQVEVPGVTMDQLDVYTTGQELTMKGRRTTASSIATGTHGTAPACGTTCLHRQELRSGEFQRTLLLPFEVEPERIEAKLENGLLTVTIPKPEVATAKRIHIQEAQAVCPPDPHATGT
jgi:HSP20 family protein